MNFVRPFLVAWILIFLSGCSSPESKMADTTAPVDNSKRPPLKVWVVDAPELEKELQVRWQAASDQPVQIESLSSSEVLKREAFVADVVIYPANLIGSFVQKDWISKLPMQAVKSRNSGENQAADGTASGDKDKADAGAEWPARWRSVSSYGSFRFALPLGASPLVAISHHLDTAPLSEMDAALSTSADLNTIARTQWANLVQSIESSTSSTTKEREAALLKKLDTLSAIEKDCLVDRFLWIASTTNARRKGLFDLDKMYSRLDRSDFLLAAKVFIQLARAFPESMLAEHRQSWDAVVSQEGQTLGFTIASPSTVMDESIQAARGSESKSIPTKLTWNPSRGLIASVGKKTRQTAVSCQFLVWISEPEQRESLRAVCDRIDLNPGQPDRNSVRDDYREYQSINTRESRAEGAELSLRIANANQYRAFLADALVDAIKAPDQAEQIIRRCSESWDTLTNTLGLDIQRRSLEQSLGYGR